ncbi:hypothetical protein F53441_8652 [Fusarium austroafricanum]|uniref:Uncharacterized protein n=1 Tax=Fusarium austroafricanum TaxID=2364996 RepID=A0A8H4KAW1_9HYPO|nr:hypothetical protein F53441_8652 [Fusarium austroafricanum]
MSNFDPSAAKTGENHSTMEETENQVSLAYGMAIHELDVILELLNLVEEPSGENFQALISYRDQMAKDIRRLLARVNISSQILKARDAQFHYQAKRLRTTDRIDRLRLWNREKKQELEAARLRNGEKGYEAARQRFEEQKRVMIKCYRLEDLWEKAMQREKSAEAGGDDLSSDCETSMEE